MEYVQRGDLSDLMKNKALPADLARFYAAEILVALQFLHERKIVHRDIKP
jgi:serine/threonine protein kinase